MINRLALTLCGVLLSAGVTLAPAPAAHAAPNCSDIAVVFARGTGEPGGPPGLTGLAFAAALRALAPASTVSLAGVDYPATGGFLNRFEFAGTVLSGARTMQALATRINAVCPRTALVLGGFSQGAMVTAYALNPALDAPVATGGEQPRAMAPLAKRVADRIAAVTLFAPPSPAFLRSVGSPRMEVAQPYTARTLIYCFPADNVCDGAQFRLPDGVHSLYIFDGATTHAAANVALRLATTPH